MTTVFVEDELRANALNEQLQPRRAVEEEFAQSGRTYRHGKVHRVLDRHVLRPVLKWGLSTLGLYAKGRQNSLQPLIRRVALRYPYLPASFDGFRILHLSDFHIDGVDQLAEILESILPEIQADVCFFTGDYRFEDSGPCPQVKPRMARVARAITAEHGILGILGNHDSAQIAIEMEEIGVRMLVNESVQIRKGGDSIWVAGVDDPFDYRCHDLENALRGVPRDAFKILLAHAPEVYEDAEARGVDLCLSGHTHAGQIRLPLVGAIRHNSTCPKEFAYGLWRHGKMRGYTTSGIGCSSVPVRFNCPPEIAVLELKRGGEALE